MVNALHSYTTGEGHDVVLLHGLFGQGSNLGGLARALKGRYRVHSLDLPDHGRSFWTEAPSPTAYAAAVSHWLDQQAIAVCSIVGHSLGGKVAMALALQEPRRLAKVVVADIAPIAYAPSHFNVFAGIAAVEAASCATRSQAKAILSAHVADETVRQFLLLSLKKSAAPTPDAALQWQLNWRALRDNYSKLLAALEPNGFLDAQPDLLFIRGGLSNYVPQQGLGAIEGLFPGARVETIAGASHWLHAEQPTLFNTLVAEFLSSGR